MKYHLWDCFDSSRISVNLNKKTRDKILNLIKGNLHEFARKVQINPARLYEYFIWQKSQIPLNKLMEILKINKLPLSIIEENIDSYKQILVPAKNSVKSPKLPVAISPYLTSIIANLFFDGSVPKDGKGTYYNQKNDEIMRDFIEKIKFVFGEVYHTTKLDHRGVLKCRVPRIIGEICRKLYDVKSFGTFEARIPEVVYSLGNTHKIAFILTGIIDEGSIAYDGSIIFGVSNKCLCKDFRRLCLEVGLKTTKVTQKSKSDHYYFYIKSKEKLLELIKLFNRKYPLISLHHKEARLRQYFKNKREKSLHTKEFGDSRKEKIKKLLKESPMSVNQLSVRLNINPRSLRRHLKYFVDKNQAIKKHAGNEYIYSLNTAPLS